MGETEKTPLELAEELDEMEGSVKSNEAEFLEWVLRTLKAGKKLKKSEVEQLSAMHEKYFGEKEEEEPTELPKEENDVGDDVE